MESTFTEDIGARLTPRNDPWEIYLDAIDTAEAYWVELFTEADVGGRTPDAETLRGTDDGTTSRPDVEDRLMRIKSLFDNGAISELEYQRQRQRILDEI